MGGRDKNFYVLIVCELKIAETKLENLGKFFFEFLMFTVGL